ncbi:MAG: murein biosynthesis integral membrane protein MurJ [Patescibacteria group bacterium]
MQLHYIINRKTFFKGSAALAITTVLSYILGLLRDRQFAHTFGASPVLDAYNAAFTVPDLILNIFVAGALTAAFIPLFTSTKDEERPEFINSVLNSSLLVVFVCGVISFFLAPQLSHLIVPGFDDVARHSFVILMRILLLSPIIFAISNTLGSILVSHERFFWFGISAALYNTGIILGTIFLVPIWGIYGVAVGTLAGAVLHLIPRLIATRKWLAYRPKIHFSDVYRNFVRLMIPKMAGHPIEQLTFAGFTIIASSLGAGSIAIMNFARNFESMPVNVIGATFALTVFPALSRAKTKDDFNNELWFTGKVIVSVTILAALVMYLIRRPLISILLGGGEFGADEIALTAATFSFFALAIPTESLSHLLARSFYALKNSLTPTLISIGGLVFALGAGYYFSRFMGVRGLALGFFVGSLVKIILLWILLRRETDKVLT